MNKDELAKWVSKRLTYHHLMATGVDPVRCSFTPKDETLDKLYKIFTKNSSAELDEFLKDSLKSHLHRTRKTDTPFYVNSTLLAKTSLEYLELYKQSTSYNSDRSFEEGIRQDLITCEYEFLRVAIMKSLGQDKQVWPSTFFPNPWWVVASELFGRFSKKEVPDWWFDSRPIVRAGRVTNFQDEFPAIKKRVTQEKRIQAVLNGIFTSIITETTMHFLTSIGVIVSIKDTFKNQIITSSKLFDGDLRETRKVCKVSPNMKVRDLSIITQLTPHFRVSTVNATKKRVPKVLDEDLIDRFKIALSEAEQE